MALDTSITLRKQVMYCVFVRNYSEEGTFAAVQRDLDRIQKLGVDVIWLMPIHPVGEKARKGTAGSPYANRDYRAVDPNYGTRADLISLVEAIHQRGMRCIIDVVYHHTSPDSVLAQAHPEWFYHREDGSFGNRVGEWTDIIDLDFAHPELRAYLIETLRQWAQIVDGFRCDVASLIPLSFWEQARDAVREVRPDCLWLAESVEPGFIRYLRQEGQLALSDGELYRAFDLTYDYDLQEEFTACFSGGSLAAYLKALNRQEALYPANYVKLHFLENHDRPRAHKLIPDAEALRNWTAFLYFMKGMTLLYNGQELGESRYISLFEKEPICWEQQVPGLDGLMRRLYEIKQMPVFAEGSFTASEARTGMIVARRESRNDCVLGVFGAGGVHGAVQTGAPDGCYENLLDGTPCEIKDGCVNFSGTPLLLRL